MSYQEIMLEGTIQSDGTLHLDEKPNLSPGRVTVVLRQESAPEPIEEDMLQFVINARKKFAQAGCHFMNDEELQAHIEWTREGDRIDELLKDIEPME